MLLDHAYAGVERVGLAGAAEGAGGQAARSRLKAKGIGPDET